MDNSKFSDAQDHKQLYIAWIKFQRRPANMQPWFGFNLVFIPSRISNKYLKPFDYAWNAIKTFSLLLSKKPNVLMIQLPPTPLLNVATLYKLLFKNTVLVIDCHNGLFTNPWRKYLGDMIMLNKADIIVTHNSVIGEIACREGVDKTKMMVLETKPANQASKSLFLEEKTNHILMPCAFAYDEPLDVVFKAAKLIPHITFLISGDPAKNTVGHDLTNLPNNVKLTGYLSNSEYETLFRSVDAVLGLTTESHVQLSVANEATGFIKPMVLSDTPLLRDLFNKGAIYVHTLDSRSIATGIEEAIKRKKELASEVQILRDERNIRWEKQAIDLKMRIKSLVKA